MLGMNQRLQLARSRGSPFVKDSWRIRDFAHDFSEKPFLGDKGARLQSSAFSSKEQLREIDVGSDILFARTQQHIFDELMLPVASKSSGFPLRSQELLRLQSIINRQQFATLQTI